MFDKWHNWDWVKKGHNRLVITFGESWTWGDSLGNTQHKVYDDREFRLTNVYGAQLADMLEADFINIAEPGQSNLWIADHIQWAKQHINELGYDKVYYVATLTEVGREFNGNRDHERVYTELLKDVKTLDGFLNALSQLIADDLSKHPDVYIGTNFVESNYPANLNVLSQSWTELIAHYNNQQLTDKCTVVQSWVFDRFDAVFEFELGIDRTTWLKDMLVHMERAERRTRMLIASPLNYKKASKHPTPTGHQLWAKYLFDQISSSLTESTNSAPNQ